MAAVRVETQVSDLVALYDATLNDHAHVSLRRQNLTAVFIGLNTITLSGLAVLIASSHLDQYWDVIAVWTVAFPALWINILFRSATERYDTMITAYAQFLRSIEFAIRQQFGLRELNEVDAPTDRAHPGVMTVIGRLRRSHWTRLSEADRKHLEDNGLHRLSEGPEKRLANYFIRVYLVVIVVTPLLVLAVNHFAVNPAVVPFHL